LRATRPRNTRRSAIFMVKEPVIEGPEIPVLNVISLKFYPLKKHPSQAFGILRRCTLRGGKTRPKDRHHAQGFEKNRSESHGQQDLDAF
jgi:hypothetical protein